MTDDPDRVTWGEYEAELRVLAATEHPQVLARLGRWRARFDPRPGDVDVVGGSFVVVDEVWTRDDYRVAGGLSGTVLDIGANVGAFTVLAVNAGAEKVVAVEPYRSNRARLAHHVVLNDCRSQVLINFKAVTAETGNGVVMVGAGGGAHIDPDGIGNPNDDGVIETLSLRDLIERHAPIRFLKMDIEGGEYEAFSSVDAHFLHENVEQIAMEFHGPVMPHLGHLDDGRQVERWSAMVALLADCGRLEIMGHPTVGGLIWWRRY